jgi:hypothetical protein
LHFWGCPASRLGDGGAVLAGVKAGALWVLPMIHPCAR